MTKQPFSHRFARVILPASVFVLVWGIHYVWQGYFPEMNPAQSQWVSFGVPARMSWLEQYIKSQNCYLGFSYALSLAFAAIALRRYREQRFCCARNLAVGGVTLSGFLAVAGCYLLGCCGSPMLAVYMSLFGATFLPLGKPIIAAITTIFVSAAYWWMNRAHALRNLHTGEPTCLGRQENRQTFKVKF